MSVLSKKRARTWSSVFYLDNGFNPKAFIRTCEDVGITGVCSPLHDKDIFTADDENHSAGDLKKPHYHVVVLYPQPKSGQQVYEFLLNFDETLKMGGIRKCESTGGMLRYLIHSKEEEGKYSYSAADVLCTGDTNYAALLDKYDAKKDEKSIGDVMRVILAEKIDNITSLSFYFLAMNDKQSLAVVSRNSYFFSSLFKNISRGVVDFAVYEKEYLDRLPKVSSESD